MVLPQRGSGRRTGKLFGTVKLFKFIAGPRHGGRPAVMTMHLAAVIVLTPEIVVMLSKRAFSSGSDSINCLMLFSSNFKSLSTPFKV